MNKKVILILRYVALTILACVFLSPFLISIILSVKSKEETAKSVLSLPGSIHWENFVEAFQKADMLISMKNSIVVTVCAVMIVILCASMAAYGIARQYQKRLFKTYETILMASMMIPFQTLMIPVYRMFRAMGLLNTLTGAVIMIAGMNLAFGVMMYVGFIKTLPKELEEAAEIEGCGAVRVFFQIVFPLIKPVTFTLAVLDSLWIWNEFNVSLLLLQKKAVKTIPIQQYVFFGEHASDYNLAFAAAVIAMIPIVIFFLFARKYIVKGLINGAVKG